MVLIITLFDTLNFYLLFKLTYIKNQIISRPNWISIIGIVNIIESPNQLNHINIVYKEMMRALECVTHIMNESVTHFRVI